MTCLKQLDFSNSALQGPPAGIGKLSGLQRLDKFLVLGNREEEEAGSSSSSSSSSSNICELRDLNHLCGSLEIHNPSGEEAASAQLHNKNSLTSLSLIWNTDAHVEWKEKTSEDVLQALRPCPTLPELRIEWYPGCTVPTWLGDSTTLILSGLQKLFLYGWDGCTNLPALGNLPELRRLEIGGMSKVTSVGAKQGFPKLEELHFYAMAEWEEWDLEENLLFTFPCLIELHIHNCTKLRSLPPIFSTSLRKIDVHGCTNLEFLPQEIASLKQLQELEIKFCPKLEETCNKEGAQWFKIQHIPRIRINFEDVRQNA